MLLALLFKLLLLTHRKSQAELAAAHHMALLTAAVAAADQHIFAQFASVLQLQQLLQCAMQRMRQRHMSQQPRQLLQLHI
jgi:hypothetical protein